MRYNNDVWKVFDLIFTDFGSAFDEAAKSDGAIYSTPNFPPVNVYIDETTKDLNFMFALAGYKKEDVKISFEGDKMIMSIQAEEKEIKGKRMLRKGIKTPEVNTTFIVPSSKYKTDEATADMENGILKIFIPAVEKIKPRQLMIS
jgi:HSP20 family molecular chaperone IbpA